MKHTVEHIFRDDGRLFRRTISEGEIILTPEVVASLNSEIAYRAVAVDRLPIGWVNIAKDSGPYTWVTVALSYLPLRTTYKLSGETLVPTFSSDSGQVLTMKWVPPTGSNGMRLCFMMRMIPKCNGTYGDLCYLFALSEDSNTWHLPLGNLYDDCRICMGRDSFQSDTVLNTLKLAIETFENSEWNADLWKDPGSCQRMFRFRPLNDGFEQQPISIAQQEWTRLAQKVGVGISKFITP